MRLHESIMTLDFGDATIVEASDIRPSDKHIGYIEYSDVENYDIYELPTGERVAVEADY